MQNNNKNEDPEIIQHFLANQSKELQVRAQEIELRKQEDNNQLEYSKAALDANQKDRENERNQASKTGRDRLVFSFIVILLLILLFVFSIYMNKDQIVMEIIKSIIFFGSGGLGGYAFAKKDSWDKSQ